MRRVLVLAACLAAAPLASSHAVDGQVVDPTARERFLREAAQTAARYRDRTEAVADGFRRLGPDFPGMGVHWVNPGRIVSGVLRADRPAALCFIEVQGEPVLVGLAYTLPLAGDESPPAEPFGIGVWHDHSGGVSEESLLLDHSASMHASDSAFRLSMLHVWVPASNPAGVVEQNNWRLPYLRAGIEPPARPGSLAARGLSLGTEGIAYYRELLHWATPIESPDHAVIDAVLERSSQRVDAWIARNRGRPEPAEPAALEGFWHELWVELERSLSPETFERIQPLRAGT